MKYQMVQADNYCKCVRDYHLLGTGRNRKKVLIGDSDDARTATFLYFTRVHQNWPSWKRVVFSNGEVLYTSHGTMRGNHVYVFLLNDMTESLWHLKTERTKLLEWFENAQFPDEIAMADLIFTETDCQFRVFQHPDDFAICTRRRIPMEIMKLSLLQLRKLNNLIGVRPPVEFAPSANAA